MAILLEEPDAFRFSDCIEAAEVGSMSAVTLLEMATVVNGRMGPAGTRKLDRFLAESYIEVVAFDRRQAEEARWAMERYGRGRHPAKLNMGDCCSYALARTLGVPLLYKGGDFGLTDITSALTENL